MKNLKINKKLLKKGKFALIVIPIATTILLSGCELSPNGDRAKYSYTNNTTTSYSNLNTTENTKSDELEIVIEKDKMNVPLRDIGDFDLSILKVNYSSEQHQFFNLYLNNIDVNYEYENIYNFDETLKEYNKIIFASSHDSKLKTVDSNELYNAIIENNKSYKKINNSSLYKELKSSELRKIVNIIEETINDFANANSDISIERVKCVLSNLKIFKQNSSMSNAFVTNDNCLVISPNMLQFANTINGKGTDEDVLKHEIIHLLQKGCNCDLNKNENLKRNFGISYGFNNVEINSLDFTWLYEASAEKNMVNYTGHDPLVYKNMIGYLESLSIVNLVSESYNVNDTENLSFKRNLEDLYKYFGVTTQKDKNEILNLIYSIEVMQQAPDNFYKMLELETGKKKDSELIDEVNYTVKGSICETLTKLFYKNLSERIVNENVSLGDIFYIISVFENDINNHILYDSSKKYTYNKEFMKIYVDIQDNFFYQLSKSTNITQQQIEEYYNEYTSTIIINNETKNNYNLYFLGQNKINYLNERKDYLNNISTSTIRSILNEFLTKENQKVYN